MSDILAHAMEIGETSVDEAGRNTIGGRPILADDQRAECALCGEACVLFFQLDIEERFELPFEAGSHLVVTMCPEHNEALLHPSSWEPSNVIELPPRFWESPQYAHTFMALNPPGTRESPGPEDPYIEPRELRFTPFRDEVEDYGESGRKRGTDGFKIGGAPAWYQQAQKFVCSCGAPMKFVCQVPANTDAFERKPEAPEQPHTYSSGHYCLFLGNGTYVFACRDQCDPRSVWAVNQ